MKQLAAILLTASVTACSYGMTVEQLEHTSSAHGAAVRITTAGPEFRGELLEVQETGVLILTSSSITGGVVKQEQQLRLIPFSAVRKGTLEGLGRGYQLPRGQVPDDQRRHRLQLVSRFPHGLAPELLKKLLEKHGQTAVAGVQP